MVKRDYCEALKCMTLTTTPQPKNTAIFQLQPGDERVTIPEDMFIWSGFLREYKKGMLLDNKDGGGINYIIPLAPIRGQRVQRPHLEKLYEFFQLFYRHTYGSGSSATKKVPSFVDVRSTTGPMAYQHQKLGSTSKCATCKSKDESAAAQSSVEAALNEAHIAAIEARSNAKWSKLPDWAHGWFSALDKNVLIGAANVANFLTATQFIELYTLFIAIKFREMDNQKQIMEYLNFPIEDPEGVELKKLLYGN